MASRYVICLVFALSAGAAAWNHLNCAAPRAPDNGLSFIFRNGELVHFRCHPGYQMRGTPVAYCVYNVWTNSAPKCIPIRKWNNAVGTNQRKTETQRELFSWGVYGDGPRRLPLINGIWPPQEQVEQVLALGPQSTPVPKMLVIEEVDIAELRHRQLEELKKQRLKTDKGRGRRRQGRPNAKNSVLINARETVTEEGEASAKPNNHRRPNFLKKNGFVSSRKSRVNHSYSQHSTAELRRRPVEQVQHNLFSDYDTTCVESVYGREVPMIAPQIPHAFVYRYETKKNKLYPFNNYMEVKYKCLKGSVFATNAQTLYCKKASWVGEIPRCTM